MSELINTQDDMELVRPPAEEDIEQTIGTGGVDVLVVGAGDLGGSELDRAAHELLLRHPALHCLVLCDDGRGGCGYRWALDRNPLESVSSERLLATIRSSSSPSGQPS